MIPKFIKALVPLKARVRYHNWKNLGTAATKNPLLRGYRPEPHDPAGKVRAMHATYTTTISTPVAAISLELAHLVVELLHRLQPQVAADLGSGFSSYLLRQYAAQCGHACTIYSCDDEPFWLEKTAEFLRAQGLGTEGLLLWDNFTAQHGSVVPELLLHDMGHSGRRIAEMPRVLDWAARGSVVILDDMQKPAVREVALAGIRERRLVGYDLSLVAYDSYGRFPWMVVSPDKERELARRFTS
jgi:hypothetical protein